MFLERVRECEGGRERERERDGHRNRNSDRRGGGIGRARQEFY
jgi:hypothetical protein